MDGLPSKAVGCKPAPHYAARLRVCEAYFYGGPELAMDWVELVSVDLAVEVEAGNLLHHIAWDNLQEVAEQLGLVSAFGQDAVQEAMAYGPRAIATAIDDVRVAA